MAENILGLLLVTSSSRGNNVFRYPPDPFSPHARLDQPSYHPSTYTIKDTIVQKDRRELFPPDFGLGHNTAKRSSTHSASQRSDPYANRSDGQRADRQRVREWIFEGSTITGQTEEQEDSDESSVSSSSEPENEPAAISIPVRQRSAENNEQGRTSGSNHLGGSLTNGKLSVDGNGSVRFENSRRSSLAIADLPNLRERNKEKEKEKDKANEKANQEDTFFQRQYETALAYSLDFLGDMLTPPRSACNRKFEINVDELIFVGHPVTCGPDGKWAYPEEDEDLRPSARGRRRARDSREETTKEKTALRTVVEGQEFSPEHEDSSHTKSSKDEADGPPSLNMFHLVVILDKPDPKGNGLDHETTANSWTDEIYREIALKWTAAAFALQVKENWVAKNAWELVRTKEKCFVEGVPLIDLCRLVYEISPMDRSLNQLFHAIHQLRARPTNPLHSFLPTTIAVNVGEMPISMVLSPRSSTNDEAWAHWGELDRESSDEDSDSDSEYAGRKPDILPIDPWKTLLLIDDDAVSKAHEISRTLVGLGASTFQPDDDDEGERTPVVGGSRRESLATAEEDEGLLMKALIEGCDVTKRLSEIAHALRFDLDGIVIPLARELITNKKAILIDVINTRLRTVVMPTTITDHTMTLDEYSATFADLFPSLPALPVLLARLSSNPTQFKEVLPSDAPHNLAVRQEYMNALIWLLKQDLVVQVHVRARVFARPEIKEIAWRKLWHRRRERWLRRLNRASRTPQVNPTDLITPKAEKRVDPLDATAPNTPPLEEKDPDASGDEADSDVVEDGDDGLAERYDMGFSVDELEPKEVPQFEGTFIFKPATAQKDETRWLRAISEQSSDEVLASRFDVCVQYFDGTATFEEISYHTGMKRNEIEKLVTVFPDDLVTFLHP